MASGIIVAIFALISLCVLGIIVEGVYFHRADTENVKKINGVHPRNGNINVYTNPVLHPIMSINGILPTLVEQDFTVAVTDGLTLDPIPNGIRMGNSGVLRLNGESGNVSIVPCINEGIIINTTADTIEVCNNGTLTVNGVNSHVLLTPGNAGIGITPTPSGSAFSNLGVLGINGVTGNTVVIPGNVGTIITPLINGHAIFNNGTLTVNGVNGHVSLVPGNAGIGITPVPGGSAISNLGIIGINAGNGLTVTAGSIPTISDTLADEVMLNNINPQSPAVEYTCSISVLAASSSLPLSPWDICLPTALNHGQGNSPGTGPANWTIPAAGMYSINTHCSVGDSSQVLSPNDYIALSAAISFAGSPLTGVPVGSANTMQIWPKTIIPTAAPTGAPTAAPVPVPATLRRHELSMSSVIHAGCPACTYGTGSQMELYLMPLLVSTVTPSVTLSNIDCRIQVARLR